MMKKVFLIVMFLLGCGAMLKQSNAQGVNYVYDTIGPDIVACSGSVVTLARPLPPTNGYVYWCFWYVGDTNSNSYVLFDTVYSVAFAGVDVSVWLRIAVIDTTSGTSVVREVIWKRFQIHKEIIELRDTLVSCGSYLWHKPSGGTEVLTNSGDYRDTVSTALCSKQVHMLHLTIPTGDTIYYPDRWCLPGHRWKDTIFDDNQGQYLYNRDTIIGIAHCPVTDVIIVPDSNRFPLLNDIIEERACNSFDWWLNGQLRDHSEAIPNRDSTEIYRGPFRGDEINSDGCYKYYRLHLILKPIKHGIDTVVACDSLLWQDNITYSNSTTTPTHTIERPFSAGCDSLVHLNLTINRSSTSEEYQSACDRYRWHDSVYYTESGRYMFDDSSNAEGCTHTVWLNLEINHTVIGDTLRTSACDSYFWNGKPYSYREELDTINNIQDSHIYRNATVKGCDSIVYLDLRLGKNNYFETSEAACEKYTWNRNGHEYSQSGVYGDTVNNDWGCSNYYQLNLTINHIQEVVESKVVCGSKYFWDEMQRTYYESGTHEGTVDDEGCTKKMLYLTLLGIETPPVQDLKEKYLAGYDDCMMLIYPRESDAPEYFYQWQSNGRAIEGETKQYFKFHPSERRGDTITVAVSGIEFGKLDTCHSVSRPYPVPDPGPIKVMAQPNPNRGRFSVTLTEEDDPVVEAVLYNAYGTKVTAVRASAGVAYFDEALQPGMYLVVVTTQRGKTYTDKVVVDY